MDTSEQGGRKDSPTGYLILDHKVDSRGEERVHEIYFGGKTSMKGVGGARNFRLDHIFKVVVIGWDNYQGK